MLFNNGIQREILYSRLFLAIAYTGSEREEIIMDSKKGNHAKKLSKDLLMIFFQLRSLYSRSFSSGEKFFGESLATGTCFLTHRGQ